MQKQIRLQVFIYRKQSPTENVITVEENKKWGGTNKGKAEAEAEAHCIIKQAGYSKSKEGIYTELIASKCMTGVSRQPWEEERRHVHWWGGAGLQNATGSQNKAASKNLNHDIMCLNNIPQL